MPFLPPFFLFSMFFRFQHWPEDTSEATGPCESAASEPGKLDGEKAGSSQCISRVLLGIHVIHVVPGSMCDTTVLQNWIYILDSG